MPDFLSILENLNEAAKNQYVIALWKDGTAPKLKGYYVDDDKPLSKLTTKAAKYTTKRDAVADLKVIKDAWENLDPGEVWKVEKLEN